MNEYINDGAEKQMGVIEMLKIEELRKMGKVGRRESRENER